MAARELLEEDGLRAKKMAVIYNGVDTVRFQPGDRALRHQYGWKEENVVFGIIANFIPYKRHGDFVRAAALIAAKEPLARFVMAGEDRGPLKSIAEDIDRLRLQDKFTIIQGSAMPERLYPAMDAYICTSETEGVSNVLLEASACGLPLIATRAGGNSEIIREGENGFLVDIRDNEAIAERALTLLRDPVLRKAMGLKGRQLMEEKFSVSRMVNNYERLYEGLLARCS
jgi:glycosyltransferase involved in cell wall biosynthesis